MIWLDAAFPPSPAQWVADMNAVGAGGGFYYAWGGFTNYSPAHLQAARAAGKLTAAILVPGNSPAGIDAMLASVSALGGTGDPVVLDLETGSLSPGSWVDGAIRAIRQSGHRALRYGDQTVLEQYSTADGDWVSHAPGLVVRAGSWQPVPAPPPGYWGWQYAVDVQINGSMYDVTTAATEAQGFLMALNDQEQSELANDVHALRVVLLTNGPSEARDGTPDNGTRWLADQVATQNQQLAAINQMLVSLQDAVTKLQGSGPLAAHTHQVSATSGPAQ